MKKKFLEYLLLEKKYSELTVSSYEKDLRDLEQYLEEKEQNLPFEKIDKKILRNFIIYLKQQYTP